jgi:hypothetical protein
VFRADLLALRAGTIAVTIDCQVADLTGEALARYGYRRQEVIYAAVVDYQVTRSTSAAPAISIRALRWPVAA